MKTQPTPQSLLALGLALLIAAPIHGLPGPWNSIAVGAQQPPPGGPPPKPAEPPPKPEEPTPVEEAPAPPSKEQIQAALKALELALAEAVPEEQIAGIKAAQEVHAKEIAKAIADATGAKIREVQVAALDGLGRMEFEPALEELERLAKRSKKLTDDDELCAELYKAISRYAHPENLALFAKQAFKTDRPKTTRACLYAFGKVRTNDSLTELINLMNRAPLAIGNGGKGGGDGKFAHWLDLELSLKVLTAADPGGDRPAWQKWWNDNKKHFAVAEEEPELQPKMAARWRQYWEGGSGPPEGGGR